MDFIYSDGGRSHYFKGRAGDCVTRAICNATGLDYQVVYAHLFKLSRSTPRNGVPIKVVHYYLENILGWKWTPTMYIGVGCRVHLNANELPSGNLIVQVSNHMTCVKDGILYDTYNCSRDGYRCVYGYWSRF